MEDRHKKQAVSHIDYKNVLKIKSNVNPHARIMSRKRTGFTASAQRNLARAIKRARFMALVPYVSQ